MSETVDVENPAVVVAHPLGDALERSILLHVDQHEVQQLGQLDHLAVTAPHQVGGLA